MCVFGSSSAKTADMHLSEAEDLGTLLSKRGHTCINGAGRFGVMGALNRAVQAAGGRLEGVIHEIWYNDELHKDMDALHVAGGDSLAERKRLLCTDVDCFVVLPGGPGTYDELWEVVCEHQVGLGKGTKRPVVLVNVNGFYDGSLAQLQRAQEDGILYKPVAGMLHVASTAREALDWCEEQVNMSTASVGRTDEDLRASHPSKPPLSPYTAGLVHGVALVLALAASSYWLRTARK